MTTMIPFASSDLYGMILKYRKDCEDRIQGLRESIDRARDLDVGYQQVTQPDSQKWLIHWQSEYAATTRALWALKGDAE